MVTARTDVYHTKVRLSQHNIKPAKIHCAGLQHMLKYLFHTRKDGISILLESKTTYGLEDILPLEINSNMHDKMMDGRKHQEPLDLHGFRTQNEQRAH